MCPGIRRRCFVLTLELMPFEDEAGERLENFMVNRLKQCVTKSGSFMNEI